MREYFKLLYGNEANKKRLGDATLAGRLPHALLIDGPTGSGKMTLAKEIAAALNCESKGASAYPLPCGVCDVCRKIRNDSYTDLRILSRQDGKATIGVGEVSELKGDVYLSATEAEYKVYIIDGAERLTTEAQNSLLILLEEPPKQVVIMLLCESSDKILTTIKSRCQYLPMQRFTPEELDRLLVLRSEQYNRLKAANPDKCAEITVLADGRFGKALELTTSDGNSTLSGDYAGVYAIAEAIGRRLGYRELYGAISALPTKRQELIEALELVMNALRDMMLSKMAEKFTPLFFPGCDKAKEIAEKSTVIKLGKVFDAVNEAHEAIFKNANVGATVAVLTGKIKNLI